MVNNQKKVVFIMQARMTSTRLPGKVLMDIEGKSLLWHNIDRLKRAKNINEIVLAIPDNEANNALEVFAKENQVEYFRGSEHNLLERHYLAAKKYGADVVVRIPSDNPLLDPQIVDLVIAKHLNQDVDYTSNVLRQTFPVGLHVEVFNMDALEKTFLANTDDYEKEHATPYIYRHWELFTLQNVVADTSVARPEIRLTVDTQKDIDLVREIYRNIYVPGQYFGTQEVISFLDKNPHLIKSNTQQA